MSDNSYTQEDIDFIKSKYGEIPAFKIANKLGRTTEAIQMKASRLGVTGELGNLDLEYTGLNFDHIESYSEYITTKTFDDLDMCWFISGIVTAEGSFSTYTNEGNFKAGFRIGMGIRDEYVINRIAEFFELGDKVYIKEEREEHQNTIEFHTGSIETIIEEIIPFFEQYPLRGKKYEQYLEWRNSILEEYNLNLN